MGLHDLNEVFSTYYGDVSDPSGEDHTEIWSAIADEVSEGNYPDLLKEIRKLLKAPDETIHSTLRSFGPAWQCEDDEYARRFLTDLYAHLDTHGD